MNAKHTQDVIDEHDEHDWFEHQREIEADETAHLNSLPAPDDDRQQQS